MNALTFASLVRFYTKTNATTFPDSQILLLANTAKDSFANEIIKADEDYFGVPSTADLVLANDGVTPQREYPLPSDILNDIKMVEAKLDGKTWVQLNELDLTQYQRTTDEATITSIFTNNQGGCFFDLFRGSLWLYSGTFGAVSGGLKLWSYQYPASITDLSSTSDLSVDPTNTSAGLPRAFHELLARRVSIMFKTSKDKQTQLTDNEMKFDVDFAKAMDAISDADKKRPHTMSLPGETKWDNGYNL